MERPRAAALFDLEILRPDTAIVDELLGRTLRRFFTLALVALPVHLGHMAVLWTTTVSSAAERDWRSGLLLAHALLLATMVTFIALITVQRRTTGDRLLHVLPWLAMALLLVGGGAIAAIDQLVTTSITPFLLAVLIASLVLLLPPVPAFAGYLAAALAFLWLLGRTQSDASALLSNRLNAVSILAIGAVLTFLQWRSEVRASLQERRISAQQLELEARNVELHHLASHDPLTGLANRRQFELLFDHELATMRRHWSPMSFLEIDIDHFKQINDEFGHLVGDQVLQETAATLQASLRASDVVARWGGEEFVALLPGTDRPGALVVAEEIRRHVERMSFGPHGPPRVTVSIGVSSVDAWSASPLQDAYRSSDVGLLRAKAEGRNRIAVDPTAPEEAVADPTPLAPEEA